MIIAHFTVRHCSPRELSHIAATSGAKIPENPRFNCSPLFATVRQTKTASSCGLFAKRPYKHVVFKGGGEQFAGGRRTLTVRRAKRRAVEGRRARA